MSLPAPTQIVPRTAWQAGLARFGVREVPEEVPVALTYNRTTLAVMLATPADFEDFALGFSLTEGIVAHSDEIEEIDIVAAEHGVELRMWLGSHRAAALEARRRHIAGPSGCGLCGLESLADAIRPVPVIRSECRFDAANIAEALAALPAAQLLNQRTRAVHAAALWQPARGLLAAREDVGRHNALDKLAGALARAKLPGSDAVLVLTSRLSVELVQKAAMIGAPVLVGVSVPTALAIRVAKGAGISLIGVARDDGFEVFTHPDRIALEPAANVA